MSDQQDIPGKPGKPGSDRLARLLGDAVPDTRPVRDVRFHCPGCRSVGFMPSVAGVGHGCTFCDGTEGGVGPDPGVWLHAKSGHEYTVVGVALQEADGLPLVVYGRESETGGGIELWACPYLEFFDGRFVRIHDTIEIGISGASSRVPDHFSTVAGGEVLVFHALPEESGIDEFLDGYMYEGDRGSHVPSEDERALIKDAIMGFLANVMRG